MISEKPQDDNPAQLPAKQLQVRLTIQRLQAVIGLTNNVVQEGSASYWYELGEEASSKKEWSQAIYYYLRCRQTVGDKLRCAALCGLQNALWERRNSKIVHGDFDGCHTDEKAADEAFDEGMHWLNHPDYTREWYGEDPI